MPKFLKGFLFALVIVILMPACLHAQESTIEKSGKIVMVQGKEYYLHKVKKGQTLYSIAKTYNVSLDDIYRENKEAEEGLKTGQELKIPVLKPDTKPVVSTEETIVVKTDTVKKTKKISDCVQGSHPEVFNIALMMPLYLSEIDSINPYLNADTLPASGYKSLRFLQFYEGFKMAVDSLEKVGFACKLYVYDIDEDSAHVKKILKKPEFEEMDVIFGLLYGNIFSIVSRFADKKNIPIINPLSNRLSYIEGRSGVFLANPSVNSMSAEIARFVRKKFLSESVILVIPSKENEKKSMSKLRENLDFLAEKDTVNKFIVNELSASAISSGGLLSKLSKEKTNLLVLLSNDELVVANLFRQIKLIDPVYKIVVFGLPGWTDFKSLEMHDLVTYGFHTYANSFIDYSDNDTRNFTRNFRASYYIEPDDNAFRGYDVALYFLRALYVFGNDFIPCIEGFSQKSLGTRFIFKKQGNNGFENTWLNIIKYEDYTIINAW